MTSISRFKTWPIKTIICLFLLSFTAYSVKSQSLLSKPISLNIRQQKLADALNEIGKKGDFYFSYNGKLLPKDSLITIETSQQPIGEILKQLFKGKYELEERSNYIIITAPLQRLSIINVDLTAEENAYSASGLVIDERTGERLMNVSVYEKYHLAATLTDDHGYFRLKFKADDAAPISLTAGKLTYKDTTINLLHPIKISSRANASVYKNFYNKGRRVENSGFGRLLISARQKIQSMNIPDFFASRPFQVSLTPGLSSHGMFSPQVVNKFSVNLIGGYTAGVNGVEFGGLFNINRQDSRYVQAAGIFNLVGGSVHGIQLAGVHNFAIDTVKGVQLSGFINKSTGLTSGLQLSSLHNETRQLKGLQIGLVNEVDTSYGASVGLINFIGNGFYRISLTANNLMNTNLSLKTGTHAFYSTLLAGANVIADKKMYAVGLGIGHDFMFSNRVYASTEANYLIANTGLWDDRWSQAKLLLNFQLTKNISFIAGPTYNHYKHSGSSHIDGYQNVTNIPDYPEQSVNGYQTKNWLGWEAGIAFNSAFRRTPVVRTDNSDAWSIGLAGTAGIGWDHPYVRAFGGEIFTQRDLGNDLAAVLSVGYSYFSPDKDYLFYHSEYTGNFITDIFAEPYKIIPVKIGIRSKLTGRFYVGGDLGEAWAKRDDGFYETSTGVPRHIFSDPQVIKSFVFSATTGYDFGNGLDAGLKFEDYTGFNKIRQIALRLAYSIRLGKY